MFFSRPEEDGGRNKERWFSAWMMMFIVSAVLLFFSKQTDSLDGARKQLHHYVYFPLRQTVQFPLRTVSQWWTSRQSEDELLSQAQALQTENSELRAQLQLMNYYQAENRRLRMLMESVGTVTEPVLIAEIDETNIEGYREMVVIDKGSVDGVREQQAVIDAHGLVGQVLEVFPKRASVMLISDGRSRVPVYIERTRQRALLSGSPERGILEMSTLRVDSDIQVGDRLMSSGLGKVYPRGYPVAEVSAITRNQRLSFLKVTLQPLAQLDSMLEVLLLEERSVPESPTLLMGPPVPPNLSTEQTGD